MPTWRCAAGVSREVALAEPHTRSVSSPQSSKAGAAALAGSPLRVEEVVVGAEDQDRATQHRVLADVARRVDVAPAPGGRTRPRRSTAAGRRRAHPGAGFWPNAVGADVHDSLDRPGRRGAGRAVQGGPVDALTAAGVAHEQDAAQVGPTGRPCTTAGAAAVGGVRRRPRLPQREVVADQLRASLRPAVHEHPVLAVDAVGRDRDGVVALRREQLLGLEVAAMARDRLEAGRARPVTGRLVGPSVAGLVPAVQEQDERPCSGGAARARRRRP